MNAYITVDIDILHPQMFSVIALTTLNCRRIYMHCTAARGWPPSRATKWNMKCERAAAVRGARLAPFSNKQAVNIHGIF